MLFWGAPAIQQVQDAGAQQAILGDIAGVRQAAFGLSVTDAAADASVQMPDGTFRLTEGTSMLVVAQHDQPATCRMELDGWAETDDGEFQVTTQGACGTIIGRGTAADCTTGTHCVRVYRLDGGTHTPIDVVYAAGLVTRQDGQDWDRDADYLIQLDDGDALFDATTDAILTQAWIVHLDRLEWEQNRASSFRVFYEGGAVFSANRGTTFQEADPAISEGRFGNDDYILRLVDLESTEGDAFSGRTSFTVGLAYQNQYGRVAADVESLRFEWVGVDADAWCNSMLLRNVFHLDDVRYQEVGGGCDDVEATLSYDPGAPFFFEFLHAKIRTELRI